MEALQPSTKTATATIANGAAVSNILNLCGQVLVGFVMPAAWTAAVITYLVSPDNVSYVPLCDIYGNVAQATVAAATQVALNPGDMAGVRYLKLQSGTPTTPVNQGAARTLTLITRSVA